jgi:hypothetical protein
MVLGLVYHILPCTSVKAFCPRGFLAGLVVILLLSGGIYG